MTETTRKPRRSFLQALAAMAGGLALGRQARAAHTPTHFSDEPPPHRAVYQLNKSDEDYIGHVLFSVGELLRKYGGEIHLVVVAFGSGLHRLGKRPGRPMRKEHQQREGSLAQYGVEFHACGNTPAATPRAPWAGAGTICSRSPPWSRSGPTI